MPFISLKFYTQKSVKMQANFFVTAKHVCLEQQIYASQIFFTQALVVMVETFRRSGVGVGRVGVGVGGAGVGVGGAGAGVGGEGEGAGGEGEGAVSCL